MPTKKKSHLDQLIETLSRFDKNTIKNAVIAVGADKEIGLEGAINIAVGNVRPELFVSKLGAYSFFPNPPVLFNASDSPEGILDQIRRILGSPGEIITGPRSTGTRAETVTRVKERCTEPVKTRCPLNDAEMEFNFQDFLGIAQNTLEMVIRITWQYDCCNIYGADASYTIVNPPDQDVTVVLIENYSIKETDPLDLKPCTPCSPKCLRVQLSIIVLVQERAQIIPGTRRKVDIDVELCPSSNGLPRVVDKTPPSFNKDEYTIRISKTPQNRKGNVLGGGQ